MDWLAIEKLYIKLNVNVHISQAEKVLVGWIVSTLRMFTRPRSLLHRVRVLPSSSLL